MISCAFDSVASCGAGAEGACERRHQPCATCPSRVIRQFLNHVTVAAVQSACLLRGVTVPCMMWMHVAAVRQLPSKSATAIVVSSSHERRKRLEASRHSCASMDCLRVTVLFHSACQQRGSCFFGTPRPEGVSFCHAQMYLVVMGGLYACRK